MTRPAFFLVLCGAAAIIVGSLAVAANPGSEGSPSIENALLVQQATVVARDYLNRGQAKTAVEVLEANLPRINGDRKYLDLLRDAYRAYIKDLTLARQAGLLDQYKKRLKILEEFDEPAAPVAAANPGKGPGPAPAASTVPLRTQTPLAKIAPKPSDKVAEQKAPAPVVVRGKVTDPLDPATQVKTSAGYVSPSLLPSPARDLLSKAEGEFQQKRYAVAKLLYEQAFQADAKLSSEEARRSWAFCQLAVILDQINHDSIVPNESAKVEEQVKRAVEIAPHLSRTGDFIVSELRKRSLASPKGPAPTVSAEIAKPFSAAGLVVEHLPKATNGMQVAQSAHFRVFHNQTPEFADKVARIAEETCSQMSRKWLGSVEEQWQPRCDIYLHASAAEYTQSTRENAASPGHSKIELDRVSGRVVLRQIHLRCDIPSLVESVLPHETTHVVLAGQFGNQHVPRWVDEGVAVLSEPSDKIDLHKKNLFHSLQAKDLIPIRDLVQMEQYPKANQISTFYAQSVALVDYLTKEKSPAVFTQFVRDSLRDGVDAALQKHYGYRDVMELQDRFTQRILAEMRGTSPAYAER